MEPGRQPLEICLIDDAESYGGGEQEIRESYGRKFVGVEA